MTIGRKRVGRARGPLGWALAALLWGATTAWGQPAVTQRAASPGAGVSVPQAQPGKTASAGVPLPDRKSAAAAGPAATLKLVRPVSAGPELQLTTQSGKAPAPAPQGQQQAESVPPAKELSLEHFQQLAWQNNPTLVQKRQAIRQARGLWVQAGLLPNPQIGYQAAEIGNEGRAGQQGAFVQQTYRRRPKLYWAQQVQSYGIRLAEMELEAQRLRVLTDVEIAYVQAAINQRRVEVSQRIVEAAQETVRTTRLLEKAQEVSSADVLRAEAQLYQAQVELYRAKQDLEASWRQLESVVGVRNLPRGRLHLPEQAGQANWTWDALVDYLTNESPVVVQASLRERQAYANWQWQLALGLQDPQFNASVAQDTGSEYTIAGVQVTIPIPINNRNQGNAMAARARWVAMQRERQRILLLLQQQLAAVFTTYQAAAREVKLYRTEVIPRWEKAYRLLQVGYQQGEFQYTDVLQAQTTYFQAQRQALDAMLRWHVAAAQIQGLLLQGSLSSAP